MKTKETGPLDGSAGNAANNDANTVHAVQITRRQRRAKVCLISLQAASKTKSLRYDHTAD
jgi:hypothetical protein